MNSTPERFRKLTEGDIYRKAANIQQRCIMEWDEEMLDVIAADLRKRYEAGENINHIGIRR